ncbi:MAG TPA: KAP family P-loop domain-containing protein [Cyanobacteria bacterium UBA8803]|nr:KAP family P-loop domain-containing protein [Cyanobacteria bacterium UBA9273]HBL60951.1 KAP family P-loop domain-containing protein [Cyanobacteria bacterium UBA8803]
MKVDLPRFFKACNPNNTLISGNADFQNYYIDFSAIPGRNSIKELRRTITKLSPDRPTCQLFTGYSGCGKSTELRRLKSQLELEDFHVVYLEFQQDNNIEASDIDKILVAIAYQVHKEIPLKTQMSWLRRLRRGFAGIFQRLTIEFEYEKDIPLIGGKGKFSIKDKGSYKDYNQLWKYLRTTSSTILQSLNEEILTPAIESLMQQGKNGLVVIVDKIEPVDSKSRISEDTKSADPSADWGEQLSQLEDLFIERGEQLSKLNCHVIYTIPLPLMFSDKSEKLKNRLGKGVTPKVLQIVPVKLRNGRDFQKGIVLMRQVILSRAFPGVDENTRKRLIREVFDSEETLDRLCRLSGGHVQQLLELLYACLQQKDPPLSRACVEGEIQKYCNRLRLALTDEEWNLLCQVVKQKSLKGDKEKKILLRSIQKEFVFEYSDDKGSWFVINPALEEAKRLR